MGREVARRPKRYPYGSREATEKKSPDLAEHDSQAACKGQYRRSHKPPSKNVSLRLGVKQTPSKFNFRPHVIKQRNLTVLARDGPVIMHSTTRKTG